MGDPREDALAIWHAGVAAVRPDACLPAAIADLDLAEYERLLVVGGGKAGAGMAATLEKVLLDRGVDPGRIAGLVNVPHETVLPTRSIHLHPARPMGTNQPTAEALAGTQEILRLVANAGPRDLLVCLLSGGGSAMLPAPVPGVSLGDKQALTALLHRSGATIQEMNTVRKHLSLIKGGGLLRHFTGRHALSLIISDVIGDSLDVIASGPTAIDATTFADALAILEKYGLLEKSPASIRTYLERGRQGLEPETLKEIPQRDGKPLVENRIIANGDLALKAAARTASDLGYAVLNLGSRLAGDTAMVARVLADVALGQPPGTCILSGGETTVVLPRDHGLGGRNQEFVLASLVHLGTTGLRLITVMSGGTDGEDGPTDAAGAIADARLASTAIQHGLNPLPYLSRHDAYHFFDPLGGLVRTGFTQTNVMDLRVTLVRNE